MNIIAKDTEFREYLRSGEVFRYKMDLYMHIQHKGRLDNNTVWAVSLRSGFLTEIPSKELRHLKEVHGDFVER